MLKIKFIFGFVLSISLLGANCDYYFSASMGSDSNDGSLNAPYQTLDKLNSLTMNYKVACLKRGDTFRGAISLKGTASGATITAYGDGAKPIVSGAIVIKNWKASTLGNGIYEADISSLTLGDSEDIVQLFVNGELMTIARFPNVNTPSDKNWLIVDSGASDYIIDEALKNYAKPNDYWKGATLRVRNYSWTFKACEISGYEASSGKLSASCLDNQLPEWGYFIDGKLEELDYPNEWYYDATSHKIYLYPPNGIDPNNLMVEAMSYKTGVNVYWNEDNVKIDNLDVRYYSQSAINVNSSQNVTIEQCDISHSYEGLSFWNAKDIIFRDNAISNTFKNFLTSSAKSDFDDGVPTISNNSFINNALYRAYGVRYDGNYNGEGLRLFGQGMRVEGNRIENIGWTGIYLKGAGEHKIYNNLVKGALATLNDGGAISIGGNSNNNEIVGNILIDSIGNVDESNGCSSTNQTPCNRHSSYGMGIGSDSGSSGHTIKDNIIANNPDMGIRLNLFSDTTVEGNVLFNNDPAIVLQGNDTTSKNNILRSNIIYAKNDQVGFDLEKEVSHGSFSNNTYCNLYTYLATKRNGIYQTLDKWQKSVDNSTNNSLCGVMNLKQLKAYHTVDSGESLITNGSFDSDNSGWPSTSTTWDNTKLDGGSLKIDSSSNNLNIGPDKFTLQKDKWYRVSFSLIGSGEGSLQVRVNDTTDAWIILDEHHFGITTTRKEYEFVFQSSVDSSNKAKLIFSTTTDDPIYWIDNLEVMPIDTPTPKDNQKLIFTPQDASTLSSQVALLINNSNQTQTFTLPIQSYIDIEGNALSNITLPAYSSKIVVAIDSNATINIPSDNSIVIDGNAKSGETISVALANSVEATPSYQWYKNGELINTTENLYTITSSDAGSLLGVKLSYQLDDKTFMLNQSISVDISTDEAKSGERASSFVDGHGLIWRDESSGLNVIWKMNQTKRFEQKSILRVSKIPNWQIKAYSDFDGDGKMDILWRNSQSGGNVLWLMNEENRLSYHNILSVTNLDWEPIAGDMDGDNRSDIVWYNHTTGKIVVWYMDKGERKSYAYLPSQEKLNYELKAVGDFDQDGKSDLLFREPTTGKLLVWIMEQKNLTNTIEPQSYLDSSWELITAKDFNNDGSLDLLYRNSSDGSNRVWFMQGTQKIDEASIVDVNRSNWKLK